MNKGKNKILAILLIMVLCFSSLGMTMAEGSTPEPTPSVMQADEVSPTPTDEATPTPTGEETPTPTEGSLASTDETTPAPTDEPGLMMQPLMLPVDLPGESESNPATDETELAAAIDAAAGDTIYVKGDFAFTAAITIGKNLTIIGVNNPVLTVNGDYRHFTSTTPITLKLQNMTLTGINNTSSGGGGVYVGNGTLNMDNCTVKGCYSRFLGGGVEVDGNATLTNCTITGNTTGMMGGGVYANTTATLTNCTITGNTAGSGSGVYASTANLTNCTVTSNTATSVSGGGGVYAEGNATLTNCTITGNTASSGSGGGVLASTATLTNCTVTGNKADYNGGGVQAGTVNMTNCTVTGNKADYNGGGVYTPGIANLTNCTITGNTASGGSGVLANAIANIYGSIVAGNTAGGNESNIKVGGMDWFDAPPTDGNNYNIIGQPSGYTIADIFGTANPTLGGDGTILIDPTGPAHNAIPAGTSWLPTTDQRGISRPQGAGGDIGAVELNAMDINGGLVVRNTADDGIASLRWCVEYSETGDTITFDPAVFTGGQVITLDSRLVITQNLTIEGPTASVEIKVNDDFRHFYSTTPNVTLKLQNMTLTGRGTAPGGGVYVGNGTLTMDNCTVRDSYNTGSGGGVYVYGNANLTNCTITGNTATIVFGIGGSGGGVYVSTATLTNCTITGNTADGGSGGGVYTLDTVNIYGSIVAGNTRSGNEDNVQGGGYNGGDTQPPIDSNNYNIIGQPSGHTLADIFGTDTPTLGSDGTILIDPTGPAHNAIPAGTSWLPTTDQRGISRPQGAGGDIGAVELECYALTLTANTGGSITQGTNGEYAAGEVVSISATANNGYTFTGWVATGGGTFADATGAVTTYTMPGNAAAITANFETSIAPPVPVTCVTLDKNTLALTVNDTQTLIAAVVPANATNPAVTWASDTPSVATVDNSGVVTAKAVGTAKITVTTADGGYTAVCGVTVQENIYDFTTAFGTYTGQAGGLTGIIDADAAKFERLEVNGQTLHGSNYSTNAGSTIITLHPSYLDTLDNGTYVVRAVFTDGYADGSFIVNVQDNVVSVTGIKLDKTKLTLAVGKNATLTATVSPSNATDKGMTWSSSDTSIATVDNSGKVTGVKAGTATITVTTDDGGYTATCEVTVKDTVGLPQTGDNGNRMLWIVIMLTSVLGILCVLVWRKRRRLR